MTAPEILTQAQLAVEQQTADDPNVHTIYQGMKSVAGQDTQVPCIVCLVGQKLSARNLESGRRIPPAVEVGGYSVPTDIVEEFQPHDLRLYSHAPQSQLATQSAASHRSCHNSPMPAGVQISPAGANWVGTLGFAVRINGPDGPEYCAITNAHVSGLDGANKALNQPARGFGHIGHIRKVYPIRFGGPANAVDLALIDAKRTDGAFAPLSHTVLPEQLELGRLVPQPVTTLSVGMEVTKSGRTTGVTRGRIVGLNATSRVNYGSDGTATFTGQVVIRADSGKFSDAGDSGSGILTTDLRPVGLLFAGGGNTTIANPISAVLAALETGEFF